MEANGIPSQGYHKTDIEELYMFIKVTNDDDDEGSLLAVFC